MFPLPLCPPGVSWEGVCCGFVWWGVLEQGTHTMLIVRREHCRNYLKLGSTLTHSSLVVVVYIDVIVLELVVVVYLIVVVEVLQLLLVYWL